jgi:hypothetical protein
MDTSDYGTNLLEALFSVFMKQNTTNKEFNDRFRFSFLDVSRCQTVAS